MEPTNALMVLMIVVQPTSANKNSTSQSVVATVFHSVLVWVSLDSMEVMQAATVMNMLATVLDMVPVTEVLAMPMVDSAERMVAMVHLEAMVTEQPLEETRSVNQNQWKKNKQKPNRK